MSKLLVRIHFLFKCEFYVVFVTSSRHWKNIKLTKLEIVGIRSTYLFIVSGKRSSTKASERVIDPLSDRVWSFARQSTCMLPSSMRVWHNWKVQSLSFTFLWPLSHCNNGVSIYRHDISTWCTRCHNGVSITRSTLKTFPPTNLNLMHQSSNLGLLILPYKPRMYSTSES